MKATGIKLSSRKSLTSDAMEALSARYVLGLMSHRVQCRFEHHMMQSLSLRHEVWFWERQLQPLALKTRAITPPLQSWSRLEHRLWSTPTSNINRITTKPGGWIRWIWPGWSLLATSAALLLTVQLARQPAAAPSEPVSQWLAVVQSSQAEPLWLVNTDAKAARLHLKAVAAPAATAQQDFELWLLPKQGAPQSMGVLPRDNGQVTITLSVEAFASLLENRSLAISLEPKGGSPTGAPTGPVLYHSQLLKI